MAIAAPGVCPDRRVRPARQHHDDHAHHDHSRPGWASRKATIRKDGTAVAPADAPAQIQTAIAAGQRDSHAPLRLGRWHRSFFASGYDCSGAVSYVLHAAGLLASPDDLGRSGSELGCLPARAAGSRCTAMPATPTWWIAGSAFDTSTGGDRWNQGSGPRWRKQKRKPLGFTGKYYPGF